MAELKPCPFCGGEAMFLRSAYSMRGTARGWEFGVCCKKCGAKLERTDYKIEVDFDCFGELKTVVDERQQAADAWNRRTSDG